jgi:hypothetical protein
MLGLVVAGCSMTQLRERTVDVGQSVGSIYTSQVLENLYSLAYDRVTIPSLFVVSKGIIHTSDSITPSVSFPLGNQVTRTVASGGITQVVGTYNGIGLQGTETVEQSWEITPQNNALALDRLRAVYLYVLTPGDKTNVPPPGQHSASFDTIVKECRDDACFRVKGDQDSCVPPPSPKDLGPKSWICLGKYQGNLRLATQRQMMITKEAYERDILLKLVLYSLQAQVDAEPEHTTQVKAAEKRGEKLGQDAEVHNGKARL